MRLWTVHPVSVWEQVRDAGEVWVDPRQVNAEGWVHPQKQWLANRLPGRLAGATGQLPWFAYCSRPDLRWVRHTRPTGQVNVLIEFVPPPGHAFAMPCWAWHDVFCSQYLAVSKAEQRDWNRRLRAVLGRDYRDYELPLPAPFQEELEASWERLFLQVLTARSRDGWTNWEAVAVVIRAEWVRRTQEFVGAGAWHRGIVAAPDSARM
ncbi:MAG: DUF3841 domain-containing protein [Gemmataceae bacterium]|nr:DUF3841 domain-containing protein [Gemmataceae bacterium]